MKRSVSEISASKGWRHCIEPTGLIRIRKDKLNLFGPITVGASEHPEGFDELDPSWVLSDCLSIKAEVEPIERCRQFEDLATNFEEVTVQDLLCSPRVIQATRLRKRIVEMSLLPFYIMATSSSLRNQLLNDSLRVKTETPRSWSQNRGLIPTNRLYRTYLMV